MTDCAGTSAAPQGALTSPRPTGRSSKPPVKSPDTPYLFFLYVPAIARDQNYERTQIELSGEQKREMSLFFFFAALLNRIQKEHWVRRWVQTSDRPCICVFNKRYPVQRRAPSHRNPCGCCTWTRRPGGRRNLRPPTLDCQTHQHHQLKYS